MNTTKIDTALQGLASWLRCQASNFDNAPWRNDPHVQEHVATLRQWAADVDAARASAVPAAGGPVTNEWKPEQPMTNAPRSVSEPLMPARIDADKLHELLRECALAINNAERYGAGNWPDLTKRIDDAAAELVARSDAESVRPVEVLSAISAPTRAAQYFDQARLSSDARSLVQRLGERGFVDALYNDGSYSRTDLGQWCQSAAQYLTAMADVLGAPVVSPAADPQHEGGKR